MKSYEKIALSQYLSDWPPSMTFDEVLDGLETRHPEITIWAPLKNLTIDHLVEMIVNYSEDIKQLVDVVPVPRGTVHRLKGLLEEHCQYDNEDEGYLSLEAQCLNELEEALRCTLVNNY